MSDPVLDVTEAIKGKGRQSNLELPPLLERAEQLARDESLDPLNRALAHRAAGNAHHLLSNFPSALSHYDLAIFMLEGLHQPEELGRTLHAKVALLMFMSKFEELAACANRARKLFEASGDQRRLARLDVNLSQAYTRLDRFDLVLECTERALPVLEEMQDREGLAAASLNAGIAFTWMHRFEEAAQHYRRALEIAEEVGMSSLALLCRYNATTLHYLAGDAASALREITEIRSEYARTGDARHVCLCWLDEAEILLEVGSLPDAIDAAQNARRLGHMLNLNSEIGKSLLFEAVAAMRLGQSHEAVELLDEATSRFETEHNGVWTAVAKLQTALFQGERGASTGLRDALNARSMLKDCGLPHRLAFADVVVGRIQRASGELDCSIDAFRNALSTAEQSGSDWMEFHAAYELGISLSRKNDRQGVQLFHRAERMLDSLWDRLGSDDLKLAFLNDRENVYTHLVRHTLEASPHAAFDLSDKARSRVLCERLACAKTDVDHLQSRMAEDQAFVEYFVTGDDVTIFVVNSSGLTSVRRSAVLQNIQNHCKSLERHFASCSVKWEHLSRVRDQLHRTAQHHLEALYRDLIAPVESVLPRRVVISPHGPLHAVPFHALSDGQQFFVDTHDVGYSPSAALFCSPAPPQDDPGPPLFVAFAPSGRTTSVGEVEEAAGHFPNAVLLVNPTMNQLREAFSAPRSLVHLAGHAGIDAVGGTLSWIETAEGRLTARDLTGMAITAKTVVITGCQTARRAIAAGDEWQGLMRAFYLAGATTIVSAFWDIRDESARLFAREFYKCFNGANAESAVKTASRSVRDWRSHPYFWAGFGAFVRKEG